MFMLFNLTIRSQTPQDLTFVELNLVELFDSKGVTHKKPLNKYISNASRYGYFSGCKLKITVTK